jgi:hypothetical protein
MKIDNFNIRLNVFFKNKNRSKYLIYCGFAIFDCRFLVESILPLQSQRQ